jgi:multidrug resistance efflux pump
MTNTTQLPLAAAVLALLCAPLSGCNSNAAPTQKAAPAAPVKDAPAARTPATSAVRPLLLTGVVEPVDSQAILVPPSNSSPVVLRSFVDEGAMVKTGDIVLSIDPSDQESIEQLTIQGEQAKARAEKEIADLEVRAIEAERTLVNARASLAKAKVDAALPKGPVSLLNYDRYQGERERAERDLEVRQKARANAAEEVARRRTDSELELKKLQVKIAFTAAQQELSKVRATRDGVVVHAYSEWRGERFDEGSSAYPGNTVGNVMGTGAKRVRAWALEADRNFLKDGQVMQLSFDALPGASVQGTITSMSSAPEARSSWGKSRYFRVDIELPPNQALPLVAGMSVMIEPLQGSVRPAALTKAAGPAPAELKIEGEIASRSSLAVLPPTIKDIWRYALTQLAPEGSIVKPGQPIATFQANEIQTRLDTRMSSLKEKQSELAKVKLDHAEAERSTELAVTEAQSNLERAQRKASQSKELIRRIDYDKLVIERGVATELAALAIQQRDAQQRARKAEHHKLNSEIAQHQAAIALLNDGQSKLVFKAPRAGMVLHRPNFGGEKIAVGTQVWRGMSVASLADPGQLVVNAKVPEAQAHGVQVGQAARVTVPGANIELNAKVSSLSNTYHGKSKSQPIVVRDLDLTFDSVPSNVKPGAAVQVSLLPVKGTR